MSPTRDGAHSHCPSNAVSLGMIVMSAPFRSMSPSFLARRTPPALPFPFLSQPLELITPADPLTRPPVIRPAYPALDDMDIALP